MVKRILLALALVHGLYALGLYGGDTATAGFARHTVVDVGYGFAAGRGDAVSSVSFRVAPADGASFRVRLATEARWHACAPRGARLVCPIAPAQPVAGIDQLEVIAVS